VGDEAKQVLELFSKENILVSKPVLDNILEKKLDPADLISAAKADGVWFVTEEFLQDFESEEEQISEVAADLTEPERETVKVEKSRKTFAQKLEPDFEVLADFDVTGKSTASGVLADFVDNFNYRVEKLGGILKERSNYRAAVPIERVKSGKIDPKTPVGLVCIIKEKRESSRGFKFLDVEDPSGELTVLIPKDKDHLIRAFDQVIADEVVGIVGRMSNDILIAEEITEPELPVTNKPTYSEEPVHVAFLSDLHIGSYLFLEEKFDSFSRWLAGDGNKREVADKIKYVVVAGDLVDGIGVYPSQEKELVIPDIYKQYDFLAAVLARIPDHIEIILSMGNHDAVRKAEPQPALDSDLAAPLAAMPNVTIVGNPSMVKMHGVRTLVYHGTTLDTVIGSFADATYKAPETAMTHYLRKRHLAPLYGRDNLAPEAKDYMLIREVPDVLHCGHVHTNGYATYRGVTIINSGTFQGKTAYQEQLGHVPTPALVPVMNLSNGEVTTLQF